MATVTGFTAARMLTIENTTVVDGDIVGDNLILLTREGTEIDAGNVRGPQGIQGVPGPTIPPGSITMFAGGVAPAGYLLCDGSDVSRTTYSDLFAAIGIVYGSIDAVSFKLPDMRSRFPVGMGAGTWSDSLNERSGSKDSIVVSHVHTGPDHQHTNNHNHGNLTTGNDNVGHYHGVNPPNYAYSNATAIYGSRGIPSGWATTGAPGLMFGAVEGTARSPEDWIRQFIDIDIPNFNSAGYSNTHAHDLTIPNYSGSTGLAGTGNTGNTGASGVDANLPPYITVNFIIKF
ncbi:MAG: phage tail protein [Paenisporosarcina sp.]